MVMNMLNSLYDFGESPEAKSIGNITKLDKTYYPYNPYQNNLVSQSIPYCTVWNGLRHLHVCFLVVFMNHFIYRINYFI